MDKEHDNSAQPDAAFFKADVAMREQPEMEEVELARTDEFKMAQARETVAANAERVAKLGEWPPYIEPGSLLERLPKSGERNAPGFDAGIACALNLIPEAKQTLAARLHANYSKASVMQIREEAISQDPDSQTAWWLAACSICKEGGIDTAGFLKQLEDFKVLASDPLGRVQSARHEFETMIRSFELKDGVPYGEKDGCIQGAYVDGYSYATEFSKNYGIYFVGTYEDSLGLEDFKWLDEKDKQGRSKSGPVFGSRQFVKCANEDEWRRVMDVVKKKFPKKSE